MATKDLLARHVDDMWKCARCSLCKFPPLAQINSSRFYSVCCSMDYGNFHAWSGSGKIIMGLSLLKGRVEGISASMRDAILQCTMCGACDVSCKYSTDMEVLDTIFDVRRYMVKTIGAHPIHLNYLKKALEFHNPYGEKHEHRQSWVESTEVVQTPDSKMGFFTGCTAAYRQSDMAKASVEILTAGDVDFQILKEEHCCGSPIYRSGQVDEAIPFFEHNIELFSLEGIEEIITPCPGCYAMFVAEYPKYLKGELLEKWKKIKFRHMVDVTKDLIWEKKIEFLKPEETPQKEKVVVTYHDPCHLGRGGEPWVPEWSGEIKTVFNGIKIYEPPKKVRRGGKGVYGAPRKVLKNMKESIEFIEMHRINEFSYCCGSGGGVKAVFPEMALDSAVERIQEAKSVLDSKFKELYGPEEVLDSTKLKSSECKILVSACPFCKTNFEEAITKSGVNIRYMDINQLVRERMKPMKEEEK